MTKGLAILLMFIGLLLPSCEKSQSVPTATAACTIATARVTTQRHLPKSHVAFCDDIPETSSPDGYYLMSLHAQCFEEECGSTNMGWFVVQKATGKVFEWDVAESKLGQPVVGES